MFIVTQIIYIQENMSITYISLSPLQSKTIKKFMKQIVSLQSEVKMLAETQAETADLIQQQEKELTKERKYSEELRQKYRVSLYIHIAKPV